MIFMLIVVATFLSFVSEEGLYITIPFSHTLY
jgi:hypothetical protein